jgi:hypothetical protein
MIIAPRRIKTLVKKKPREAGSRPEEEETSAELPRWVKKLTKTTGGRK